MPAAFPSRYVNQDAARLRFGDRVDRLGAFLTRTDPLADEAVVAIDGAPRGAGWRALEEGLRHGSGAITDAPDAVRAYVREAERVPTWVDWETCTRGGAVLLRAGPLGGAVLGARSLVLGYASPGGNKPLVFSGRLTEGAPRRLSETSRFVHAVALPGGMRPYGEGWQITLKVRLIHARVRKMILASGRWNESAWGAPINQHDMAGTTLLFSIALVEGLRTLGMDISVAEADPYMHLWRWVGTVMGVDAELLPASEPEAHRLADLVAATQGPPDDDARALTRALLESPRHGATSREERRLAERRVVVGRTLCRALLGDALADALAVPTTHYRYAIPLVKRLVGGAEHVRRAFPFGDDRAVRAGERYWEGVVRLGRVAEHPFPLPERLGRPD